MLSLTPELRDSLHRSPFFAAAGERACAPLLAQAALQQLPTGSVLFQEGEMPAFLHVLLSGSIGLRAQHGTGNGTIVEIFPAGEAFLVPAILLDLPYLVSAEVLADARLLLVPAGVFRQAMLDDPGLSQAALFLLSRHWRLLVEQISDLKLRSAEQRLARFLARRVSEESGAGPAAMPESRGAIAARLGMTPETMSRALHALATKGLIRVTPRRADVIDRNRLLQV